MTPLRVQPPRRAKTVATESKPTPTKPASTKRRGRPPKKPKKTNVTTVADVNVPRKVDILVSHGKFSMKPLSMSLSSLPVKCCISMDDHPRTDDILYGSADQWEKNSKSYFECYKKIKSAEYSAMIRKDANKNDSLYESLSLDETKYDSFEDSLNEDEEKLKSDKHFSSSKNRRQKSKMQAYYDSLEDVCSTKSPRNQSVVSCENSNSKNVNLNESLKSSNLKTKFTGNELKLSIHAQSNFDEDSLAVPDIENTFDDSLEDVNMISSIDELNDLESVAEQQIPEVELCSGSNQLSGLGKSNLGSPVKVIYERDGFQVDISDKLSEAQSKLYDSLSDSDGKGIMVDSLDETGSGCLASSSELDVNRSTSSINEPEKILSIRADSLESASSANIQIKSSPCVGQCSNRESYAKSTDNLGSFMSRYSSEDSADIVHCTEASTVAKPISFEKNSDIPMEDQDSVDRFLVDQVEQCSNHESYAKSTDNLGSLMSRYSSEDSADVVHCTEASTVAKPISSEKNSDIQMEDQDSVHRFLVDQADSNVECLLHSICHETVEEPPSSQVIETILNKTYRVSLESDHGKAADSGYQADVDVTSSSQDSTHCVSVSEETCSEKVKREKVTVHASELKFLKDKFNIDLDMSRFQLEIEFLDGDNKCKMASEKIKVIPVTKRKNDETVSDSIESTMNVNDDPDENEMGLSDDVRNVESYDSNINSGVISDTNSKILTKQVSEEDNILISNMQNDESNLKARTNRLSQNRFSDKSHLYDKPSKVGKSFKSPTLSTDSFLESDLKMSTQISRSSFQKSEKALCLSSFPSIGVSKPKEKRPSTLPLNSEQQHTSNSNDVQPKKSIVCPSKIQRYNKLTLNKSNEMKTEAFSSCSKHDAIHPKVSPSKVKSPVTKVKNSAVKFPVKPSEKEKQSSEVDGDLSSPSTEIEVVQSFPSQHKSLLKSKTTNNKNQVVKNLLTPSSGTTKQGLSSRKISVTNDMKEKQALISPNKQHNPLQLSKSMDMNCRGNSSPVGGKHTKPPHDSIARKESSSIVAQKNVKETSSKLVSNKREDSSEKSGFDEPSLVPSSATSETDDKSFVTCQSNLSKATEGEETEPSESDEFVSCPESPTLSETNITYRSRGKSSVLAQSHGLKCDIPDSSLLSALDLHDVSLFYCGTRAQSNDSIMPLNLCFKDGALDKPELPLLSRDESKENCANIPYDMVSCENIKKLEASDGFKTPRNCRNIVSKENNGTAASGTKIPIRKIPAHNSASKKPILKSAGKEKRVANIPCASEKEIPSPSSLKKHYCNVRNTIFSKVPQIVTPKKFVHIQSPIANYIRHGQYCLPAKGANEPVLRDCMNKIDFKQNLNAANEDNHLQPGGFAKLKRKQ